METKMYNDQVHMYIYVGWCILL